MKSLSPKRNQDSFLVPEGSYVEPGTFSSGNFESPCLQYELAYFKIHVNADAVISFKDKHGNVVPDMAVSKGPVPYLMSAITACTVAFFVIHEGTKVSTQMEMTGPIYTPNTGIV